MGLIRLKLVKDIVGLSFRKIKRFSFKGKYDLREYNIRFLDVGIFMGKGDYLVYFGNRGWFGYKFFEVIYFVC